MMRKPTLAFGVCVLLALAVTASAAVAEKVLTSLVTREHMHADIVVQHEACCTYVGEQCPRFPVHSPHSVLSVPFQPRCLQKVSQLLRTLLCPGIRTIRSLTM